VADVVYEVVAEVVGRPVAALGADDRLDDLGVTGLVLLDVIETVGEELGERTVGLDLDDDDVAEAVTLGDLIALVTEGLGR
jgi:hypothetical protein